MSDRIFKARVVNPIELKKSLDETEVSEQKIKLILEKGRKPLADGTIREWQGKKYKKEGGKWMPVGTGRGRGRPKGTTKKSEEKIVIDPDSRMYQRGYGYDATSDYIPDFKNKEEKANWEAGLRAKMEKQGRIKPKESTKKDVSMGSPSKETIEPDNVEKGFIKITTPITDKKLVKELKSKVFVSSVNSGTIIPESKIRAIYKVGDYYFAIHKAYLPSRNIFGSGYTVTNLDTGMSASTGSSVENAIENFNKLNISVDKFNEVIKHKIDKMETGPKIEKKPYVMNEDDKQKADIKSKKEQLYKDAVQKELDNSSAYDENGVVRARKVTDKATREKVINSTYYSGNLFLNGTGYSYLIKVPSDKVTGVLEIGEGNYAVVVPIFDSVTGEFSGKKSLIETRSGAKMYNASMEYGMRANGIPFKETPSTENDFAYHATLGLKHVKGSGITKDDIDKVIKKAVDSNKDAKKFESLDDYKKYVEELVNKEK